MSTLACAARAVRSKPLAERVREAVSQAVRIMHCRQYTANPNICTKPIVFFKVWDWGGRRGELKFHSTNTFASGCKGSAGGWEGPKSCWCGVLVGLSTL